MSQSVKLSDGSYIDSAGVWSNAEGKSLEALLTGESYDIGSIITAAGYQNTTSRLTRVGKLVNLCVNIKDTKTVAENTTLFTLPQGYRPAALQTATFYPLHGGNTANSACCQIRADGTVVILQPFTANFWMHIHITYLAQ